MEPLQKGRLRARLARTPEDVYRAQALRHLCFKGGPGRDHDAFDDQCDHVLIEDHGSDRLLACYRVLALPDGAQIGNSYSAQFYDLARLTRFEGPVVEMGRFCVAPDQRDPDILRLAWGAMTRLVDALGAGLLFGCASFTGTDAAPHHPAFALLGQAHLAPARWRPQVKAPRVFPFGRLLAQETPDPRRGMMAMPPLLRTYLGMGGWVSDHAVVDLAMNTLHVFTGVEIRAIPAARARALRLVAGG